MRRLVIVAGIVGALGGTFRPARGQDIESIIERAARDKVREALDPQRIEKDLTQRRSNPATTVRGELVPVKTHDGWTLVAHHYRPTAAPKPGAPPVILCHGLTYNAAFWDLDPSCSLPSYLAAQGFDVWAVSLRGCGLSQKWVWSLDEAPEVLFERVLRRATHGKSGTPGYASIDPKYAHWTMDDHIAIDVPTFVNLVRHHTGAEQVAWVGHSMGGIVALACLARYQNPGIGRLVTVGSQLTMPSGEVPSQLVRELIRTREGQLAGSIRGADLAAQSRTSVQHLFFNVQDVSPAVYEALTTWAADVPSVGLMRQYLALSERSVLLDAHGKFNYTAAAANIKVPILLACGASDRFAPPPVQKFLFDHVGSTDKSLVVFGRSGGYAVDAGHNDALVGLHSKEQVFPVIARWLATQR
jgi:pimeloyl-ACP methyl ester carboxylesterase